MIRDLLGTGEHALSADVLIVGAGTAGLVMATRLAARGKKVVCLESGGREQASDNHELNEVEQVGAPYSGAEHGRFRCLGGSSTRWGGALIPFQAADLTAGHWPLDWDVLSPYLEQVERLFGLPAGSYEACDILAGTGHLARFAKWPPFARRNVYSLLRDEVESPSGPEVWINATAAEFVVESGQLVQVGALASDGSRLTVRSSEVVITAGAIESTRLLLLIDLQTGGEISRTSPSLGQGFQDHLSAVVATLEVSDRASLNRLAGFRFASGGGMTSMRFELAPDNPQRSVLPACFAHVGFSESGGGFGALRDIYRMLQRRKLPKFLQFVRLLGGLPWLCRAVWWRFVYNRLLYPDDSAIELHMVIEQERQGTHRIGLSDSLDSLGLPMARIDWAVSVRDEEAMAMATAAIIETWRKSVLNRLARPVVRDAKEAATEMGNGGGIYHPTGSTRMGRTPQEGVVDIDLKVFALKNVSVVSTSALPTGGGANPTMMLLLLALRCADRMSAKKQAS